MSRMKHQFHPLIFSTKNNLESTIKQKIIGTTWSPSPTVIALFVLYCCYYSQIYCLQINSRNCSACIGGSVVNIALLLLLQPIVNVWVRALTAELGTDRVVCVWLIHHCERLTLLLRYKLPSGVVLSTLSTDTIVLGLSRKKSKVTGPRSKSLVKTWESPVSKYQGTVSCCSNRVF